MQPITQYREAHFVAPLRGGNENALVDFATRILMFSGGAMSLTTALGLLARLIVPLVGTFEALFLGITCMVWMVTLLFRRIFPEAIEQE